MVYMAAAQSRAMADSLTDTALLEESADVVGSFHLSPAGLLPDCQAMNLEVSIRHWVSPDPEIDKYDLNMTFLGKLLS